MLKETAQHYHKSNHQQRQSQLLQRIANENTTNEPTHQREARDAKSGCDKPNENSV